MNITTRIAAASAVALTLASAAVLPAFAATASSTQKKADRQAANMTKMEDRGAAEIDRRIASLNALITRVGQMQKVSSDAKTSITATLTGIISNLTALKDKLPGDTASTTLKADVQSVTQAYRVYALVMPETSIIAAADREMTISDMLSNIGQRLSARLSADTSIPNLASLQASLSDMSAKIADARTQAQAAVSAVTVLSPDNGDKTVMASNTATLKESRTKIKAAQADLVAARKDSATIIAALAKQDKAMGKTASSTSMTSPTTASTTQQ